MSPIKKVGIYGATMFVALLTVLISLVPSAQAATVNDEINPGCDAEFATILRLYESYLGRGPDGSGANYWLDSYVNGVWTMEEIKLHFYFSNEFQGRYGNMTNPDFVNAVYQNVFERDADAGGFAYWLDRLNNGLSRSRFIQFIADSPEFRDSHPYELSSFCEQANVPGYTTTNVHPGMVHAVSPDGNINVATIDMSEGALTVSPGSALAVPGAYGGTVAVNGNWFNSPRVFYGFSVSEGTALGYENGDSRHAWIGTDGTTARFAHTNGQVPIPADITHAVTGKLMVANGARFDYATTLSGDPAMTGRAPRTAAGITADGFLVLITVDGRGYGPGMTSTELADFMIGLGIQNGIMLDGGGSTAMFVDGEGIVNDPSDGSARQVRNQLIFTTDGTWVD